LNSYPEQGYISRIARNTFYNALARIWGMLVSFFLTPYILSRLGVEYFGIWSVVWILTGYMGLLDMGLSTSFVRHTSLYYAKGDREGLREMISSGLFFYAVMGALILVAIVVFTGPLLNFFNLRPALRGEATTAIILGVISLGISNLFNVFNSVLYGLQRLDISFKIAALSSLPLIIGTIFVLEKGYGLAGLMYNYIFASLVLLTSGGIMAYKILGDSWGIGFSYIKRSMLKKLFRFGFALQLGQLSQMVSLHYDKMLISHFLGVAQVTYYELGSRLTQMMRSLPAFMTSAVTPAASEMEVRQGRERVWELYIRGSKYLTIAGIPLFLFITLEARDIIFVWIGNDYPLSANVVRILSFGFFMNFICSMASSVVWGIGKVELELKRGLLTIALNLALSLMLILRYGFLGAVFGTTISLIIGSIYFLKIFKASFEKSGREVLSPFIKPGIAGFLAGGLIFVFERFFTETILKNRIDTIVSLGIKGIIFLIVYSGIILSIGYFDDYDRNLLRERIPILRHIIRELNRRKDMR
jgi:O-antigen/teichoic acid export membrane protein